MARRLLDTEKAVLHIAETKNDGNPTVIGSSIDTVGWRRLVYLVGVGQTDTTVNAKAQEADAPGGAWSDVAGAAITQLSDADDNAEAAIELDLTVSGRKRYHRLLVTVGAGATGAALAVWALLGLFKAAAEDLAVAELEERIEV